MSLLSSVNFHLVKWLSHNWCCCKNDAILYLTFDDGPDPGITEFVLDVLAKHNVKATFFCCGNRAQYHPQLVKRIQSEGHVLANHTYSHVNGLKVDSSLYYADIARVDVVLNSPLFRPPWGGVSVFQYFHLRKKYRVILWDVVSNDSNVNLVDTDIEIQRLQRQIRKGNIILFHFVDKHAENTKRLLEPFIAMAISEGFSFDVLKNK